MNLDRPVYVNKDFFIEDLNRLTKSMNGDACIVSFSNIPNIGVLDITQIRFLIEIVVQSSHVKDPDKILRMSANDLEVYKNYFTYDELFNKISNILNIVNSLPFKYEFLTVSAWLKSYTNLDAVIVSTPI